MRNTLGRLRTFRSVAVPSSIAVLLLIPLAAFSQMSIPMPQIASAAGKPAPSFTLKDQDGAPFSLSSQRGKRLLLIFYRGYWCPYCMGELKEITAHKADFDATGVRLVGISVDDQEHTKNTWSTVVNKQFTLLSDPGARTTRTYGLLHAQGGMNGQDIALDSIILVDADGKERWRRVSASLPDIPTSPELVTWIRNNALPQSNQHAPMSAMPPVQQMPQTSQMPQSPQMK